MEKAGFKREGLIREGKMANTYCDYYLYGMTKADYIEITGKVLPLTSTANALFKDNMLLWRQVQGDKRIIDTCTRVDVPGAYDI